jgi:hypothetical protein
MRTQLVKGALFVAIGAGGGALVGWLGQCTGGG